jgi:hypothetical protein
MADNSHRLKRNYEWDPEQKMFVAHDNLDDIEVADTSDLSKCSVDRLAMLPDYLVPLARRDELEIYKALQDREARAKLKADMDSKDLRGQSPTINPDPNTMLNRKPEVRYGPRGGRYTVDTTRDGRPYRRYF